MKPSTQARRRMRPGWRFSYLLTNLATPLATTLAGLLQGSDSDSSRLRPGTSISTAGAGFYTPVTVVRTQRGLI